MRRRTLIVSLPAAMTGALAGCGMADPTSTAAPTAASPAPATSSAPSWTATPILGSTQASTLAPRSVTPYAPAAGSAPAQSFAVGRRDFAFDRGARPLPVRVWYPAAGASGGDPRDDADPAAGRFPLVLFSHGLTGQPNDYAAMLERWAQAGFVVAAPTYPHTSYGVAELDSSDIVNQPADASEVLTQLLGRDDPLTGHLDPDRIGAAGHSAGGITTTGLFSAERDARLTAGIVFAGTDFTSAPFTGAPAGMLFVHGRDDRTVAYDAGHTVFEAVPWSRAMLTITDGGHVTTGDSFAAITATSTEFLRWSLYGDAAAKDRLAAAAASGGIATLEDNL